MEETRTLLLEGVSALLPDAERVFTDLSIRIGTSVPDEVEVQGGDVFVKYPSVQAAMSVFDYQQGTLEVAGRLVALHYFPVRTIDLTVSYDWYCEKCDYKNFARRGKCYRCESDKTPTCKLSYSTQPAAKPSSREESAENCSLMLRGPVLCDLD
jgi:hypothetical protein